jgi:predicted dehydrogenase
MDNYKMVVIGATGSAYKRTIPALRESKICSVIAIQGRDMAKLKKISEEYGITKTYLDTTDLLRREKYDVVYIANPPFMHLDSISKAQRYCNSIICEKPLARTAKEAKQIGAILGRKHVNFMLAHHLRHQPAVHEIKSFIEAGGIGNVLSVWAQWGFKLNQQASSALWKLDPKAGGDGPFGDAGIHVIDLLIFMFGAPKTVAAHGFKNNFPRSNDNMTALLGYDNKTIVLNASQTMPYAGNYLLIYGSAGKIEVPSAFGEKSIKHVRYVTQKGDNVKEYPDINLYGAEVENFITAAQSGNISVGTSLIESIMGNEIIDAINISAKSGKRVEIKNGDK